MNQSVTPTPSNLGLRRHWVLPPGRYHRILQVVGELPIRPGATREDVLAAVRQRALGWLQEKKGVPLDTRARQGASWDYEAATSAQTLTIEASPGLWGFRLDDPCSELPGRTWRVEFVAAGVDAAPPMMGCTLSVLMPPGSDEPINPTIPALVKNIAKSIGLIDDGRPLTGGAWHIERPAEVEALMALIERRDRGRAVVVLCPDNQGRHLLDPARIAGDLAGLAHVAIIDAEASFALTRRYGKRLSVFNGAVRLYRTDFDPDNDNPFRHPLYLPESWGDRVRAATWSLRYDAIRETLAHPDEARDVPSFGVIRRLAADLRLRESLATRQDAGVDTAAMLKDLRALEDDRQTWQALAEQYAGDNKRLAQALDESAHRLWAQRERMRALEYKLEASNIEPDEPTWPDSFDELDAWADRYLAGRVVVTARALKTARRSPYLNPPLAYRALHLLATAYWRMRVEGGAELRQQFDQAAAALGLRCGPVGEAVRSGRHTEQYRVTYEGNTYELDQHLVGSDSRNLQHGLRIYYAYDEELQLVIVGSMPEHLDNSLT